MPLNQKVSALLRVMRFDKPIGTFLLLAPALWGLIIAAEGLPSLFLFLTFFVGAFVMRSAGCTTNDLTDRKLDGFVERTRDRPLVTGDVSATEAISLLVVLMGIALCLVSYTNLLTLQLSVVGALLTVVYPFMKRVTHLPQVVLGMAFSWSIPMAFAATVDSLPAGLWWLFCANLLWVVVYDTQYAMVDREDDLEVGIKSTAILFGRADTRIILMLQLLCLACFLATGLSFHLGAVYFVSIALVALLFLRHQRLISDRSREACFQAFNESKWIGFIVVAGLLGHYA
ncbi:MAG: 4-hydroxybenzoate octaprenyltransferase [Proteobacteria bacterium]|nr:4-hydroxybenzoate octaprenyltransferase [Pseudomonadota bacterium]